MKRLASAAACAALLAAAATAGGSVTSIGELRRGAMASVQGDVERISDEDEFRLLNASGTVRVYVGSNRIPVEVGEAVTVEGFVDDDLGPLEIYARSLRRADGAVVTFGGRYD